jgi:FkbM family methyltransferase
LCASDLVAYKGEALEQDQPMSTLRTIAEFAGRLAGVNIVRPTQLAMLFEQHHLKRFFEEFKVDCVFDVGANAGQYASMIRRIGFSGPIISFEPISDLANKMRSDSKIDPKWFIEQKVLTTSEGLLDFKVMARNQFSSLHDPQITETDRFSEMAKVVETIAVQATTLQLQLPAYREKLGFSRPFLKMDTQGHDIEVAKGAGDSLLDFVGIQSELAIKRIYSNSPLFSEAIEFYRSKGFELSAFVPNNAGHFPDLVEIDCILYNPRFAA